LQVLAIDGAGSSTFVASIGGDMKQPACSIGALEKSDLMSKGKEDPCNCRYTSKHYWTWCTSNVSDPSWSQWTWSI